ncbi:hypothetical protein NV226_00435 [Mycoplasma iguanae]|uniref:Uncharacterized protein n=1 Tax=Mycoplasma iguanae TaxID=292461 RepID=A0ABY5R8E2_9MOLU|nr:hypothetical protein [Mycoplasma iguanae]UVD81773.1 hypothetical protein NV226_00435 [Mycoplasma iguanae]
MKKKLAYFSGPVIMGLTTLVPLTTISAKTNEKSDDFKVNLMAEKQSFSESNNQEDLLVKKLAVFMNKYGNRSENDYFTNQEKQEILNMKKELYNHVGLPFRQSRAWGEWWGANLWVNLTVSETNWWIKKLSNIQILADSTSILTELVDEGAGFIAEVEYPFSSKTAKMIQIIAKTVGLLSNYFNANYLNSIRNHDYNISISYRFTFGFIPSGVFKGYKHIGS